jgi:hypothetical protein
LRIQDPNSEHPTTIIPISALPPSEGLDLFTNANIIVKLVLVQARRQPGMTDSRKADFQMDTAQAYGTMEEANRIIEDFPVKKYALYTLLFLLEIAVCFGILYII